jgi:nucleotide-binding universal stress UspA family protein
MFTNILVGIDGSEHSLKAATVAGDLARCMHADVWVVACFDAVPAYLGEPNLGEAIQAHMDCAEQNLQAGIRRIGEIDGEVHTQVLQGSPAEAILAAAEVHEADLIVMGTRGLGRLSGLIMGSQSQKVVAHAACPVMLVR